MNQLVESLLEITAPSPYGYSVRVAGLALAYFLAARIGLEYAVTNPVVSTVWPASGLALSARPGLARIHPHLSRTLAR